MKYCEAYAALLDLFVDGELSLEEMLEVQAHLDECPACRAYVDDVLAMQAAFPDAEDTEVPEGFAAGVMAAIQADTATRPVSPRKKKKTPWAGVVASLAACCAIVIIQQNGPMAAKNESAAASMAYDTDVVEEVICDDSAAEYSYTTADIATEETAEEPVAEAEGALVRNKNIEGGADSLLRDDAPAEAAPAADPTEPAAFQSDEVWAEKENVVFACVVFLPADRVGAVLDGYEGKPYKTDEGIVGIGYALEQAEYEEILYDFFDYTHGPELDPERTTDLCCIVVTE